MLLLPTDVYIAGGVATVVLTVLLLALIPPHRLAGLFRPWSLMRMPQVSGLRFGVNVLATLATLAIVYQGYVGLADPVHNPLPIFVWTIFWVGLVIVQGLFFDIWSWLSPWRAPAALIARRKPLLRYPHRLGHWPALLQFLGFAAVLLADIAPQDPERLARYATGYLALNGAGLLVFGRRWLIQGEWVTVVMRLYGRMAIFGRIGRRAALGVPGWQVIRMTPPLGVAVLAVALLASGSFDGVNETFLWLGFLGFNPLEFPGRSAVIASNFSGLLVMNAALLAGFALTLDLGKRLSKVEGRLRDMICLFAPGLMPIAIAYHIGHYLTALLVDGQYALNWVAETFGFGGFHVTTGFLFHSASVKLIWLTQAGAVVTGHVVAILITHLLALRAYGDSRRAWITLIPLTVFMVLYTLFGLWLLATPRGA